ncbi:MAG: RCC1 domain-containing protein [Myxococcota bacterium]
MLLVLVAACSDGERSADVRVLFDVDAALAVSDSARVAVTFWRDGQPSHRDGETLDLTFEGGVAELGVAAGDSERSRRYTIFAELFDGDTRMSWLRLRSGFLAEGEGVVRARFYGGCREPSDRPAPGFDSSDTCGSHDSCVRGECVGACVEPSAGDSGAPTPESACGAADCAPVDTLVVGRGMNCALRDGDAFCWGRVARGFSAWNGQHVRPSRIVGVDGVARFAPDVDGIEIESEHVCLTAGGQLRCGGRNNGDFEIIGAPQPNVRPCCEIEMDTPTPVAQFGLGASFTCVVGERGVVGCLGRDPNSLEPVSGYREAFEGAPSHDRVLPLWAELCAFRSGNFACTQGSFPLSGTDINAISARTGTICVVRTSGALECYGRSLTSPQWPESPYVIPGSWHDVGVSIQIVGDDMAICAIDDARRLLCWGDAAGGRTGTSEFVNDTAPIELGAGRRWQSVGVGRFHACALDELGEIGCWGRNDVGQLGSDGPDTLTPRAVCVPDF